MAVAGAVPVGADVADELVPAEMMTKIFSNIEDLRDLHQSVYDQLHEKISDIQYMQRIEHCISEIFHESVRSPPSWLVFIL